MLHKSVGEQGPLVFYPRLVSLTYVEARVTKGACGR